MLYLLVKVVMNPGSILFMKFLDNLITFNKSKSSNSSNIPREGGGKKFPLLFLVGRFINLVCIIF